MHQGQASIRIAIRATPDDRRKLKALGREYGSVAAALRALLREDAALRLRAAEVRRDAAALRRDAAFAQREAVQLREHGRTIRQRSRQEHEATMGARREIREVIQEMEADARRRVANGEDPVVVYAELAAQIANLMKGT